ncbi:TrmH family RNA methyltransferase [Bythopirellula polymerisocia]|uniref:23S rRNA (Uridine(2479)-2'-O)-methyltransferase n=1 Tax=Bythopirellula polymerisocia TaxID=2528003 RepID=A0A5C6D491_9BACT|nr:TrmH family RNA methyltransferase [Bythopirellula polymerisocia]TWU29659.1 23S rRNA (uridine(2479)-2'-O)-methyltransferase [Bythopirellula polymerisocia]
MNPRHEITSRQNERVKHAAKLRDARQRTKQGRFIIDGVREIGRALDAGIGLAEVFLCPQMCSSPAAQELLSRLDHSGAVVAEVTGDVFEKLAFGGRSDGVVVVANTPDRNIDSLELPANALVVVLERLEKPGNVGAILRSADGVGVDAVIVVDPQTDLFNPNTIRASVGTVFSRQIYTATTEQTLARLRHWGVCLFAARPEAELIYTEIDFSQSTAIVLGSEATGLSSAWQQADVKGIRLPMKGIADSLNVSTTAAVLLYEARRQRE